MTEQTKNAAVAIARRVRAGEYGHSSGLLVVADTIDVLAAEVTRLEGEIDRLVKATNTIPQPWYEEDVSGLRTPKPSPVIGGPLCVGGCGNIMVGGSICVACEADRRKGKKGGV